MWLRHFPSEDLPTCRTMIYGYDSRLTSACATHTLQDYTDGFLEELRKARGTLEVSYDEIALYSGCSNTLANSHRQVWPKEEF